MTLESKKSESVGTEARKNELTLVCKMGILFFFPSLVGNFILNKIHTTEELKSVLKLSFLHMMVTGVELYGVIDMIKFCISFYNKASISWGYKTTGAVMTGCLVNSINAMLIAMASGTRIKEETATALIGTATSWLCLCVLVGLSRMRRAACAVHVLQVWLIDIKCHRNNRIVATWECGRAAPAGDRCPEAYATSRD